MVRFAEGLGRLSSDPAPILLEVGPGRTLSTFARKQPGKASEQPVLSSMRHPRDREPDVRFLLNTLARLWLSGAQVDWKGFYAHEHRHRLDLPTYPLEQKRYWIDPPKPGTITPQESQTLSDKRLDIDDWFYLPLWKETILPVSPAKINLESCLVFEDECGVGSLLAEKLKHQCREIITVKPGESFARSGENQYTLSPRQSDDYEALIKELRTRGMPQMIIHLWSVTQGMASPTYYCCGNTQMPGEKFGNENKVLQYSNTGENRRTFEDIDRAQDLGFYSLFFLARALGKQDVTDEIRIAAVSNNMHAIAEEEELYPEKATILGPIKVIGKEFPNIRCQSIDIVIPPPVKGRTERLINQLAVEIITASPDPVIALRGVHRWVQRFESTRLRHTGTPKLREKGVYLITGGLGGIGLTLARHLAETVQARLILTGRSALPPKEEWQAWQAAHGEHDAVSHKIKTVQELESRGAEVLIAGVDAADYRQVQETIAAARQRFGEINGVIHAAGVPDGALVLRQTPGMLNAVLAPKMKGALVLDSLITDLEPDFFILCSSLMSITGFVGQTGYCAANAFLDAFALFKRTTGEPFIAVNWDGWQELGMLAAPGPSSIPGEIRNASHPLFERCIMESTGEMRFISHLNVNRHWFLDEHRIAGKAVLPGTAQLELASAALETHLRSHTIEIRDVYFLHPLVVEDNEDKEVHTLLKKQGNGFEFTINSQSGPGAWQEHARGLISSIHKEPAKKHDIDTIKRRCRQREVIIEQGFTEKSPDQLNGAELFMKNHGLHWHSLKQANLGTREGFARLELPGDLTGDLTKYQLHPALLDTATAFLYLLDSSQGDYPFYCKRVVVKAPLPAKFFSFARYAGTWGAQAGMFPFDITLMDEQGGELVEIEEYTLRQVETGSFAHKPAAPAANDRNDQGQVIVSTKNLEYRIQQVSNFMKEERKGDKPGDLPGQLHSRPQLPYAYTAPRTELEQQLARVWQTSLGIEKVGIHDDFFDLGGDSLLAFQVIARIRDTLQIELPGHSILNTPTIARLIKQNLQQFKQAAPPELPPGLVKIQAGQPGKPPLFLIHPIGGYVYIYRDLAHRLGPGQPVYGIQPRGLEGEAKPLTTVEEMAAHYIELVRSRQPQGPYYIGGSSFGGMVAFEMAHQLRGAGQHAALLAMIDTPGTRRQADKFKTDEDILKYLLDVGDNISIPPDRLARMEPMEKVRFLLEERRKTNGPGLGDLDPNNIRRSFNLFKITQMAIWNYKPRVYPGPVIFFSAMEADAYNVLNPETAWIDLVRGGLEVIRVPGNHKTMNYEPHVQVIADRLKNGMEHAAP
jgi:thioesterase domain-containing protein/acyl transferase domain-containing protein